MKIHPTELKGMVVIEPEIFSDARGYFLETYNARAFAEAGIGEHFVQDNQSRSKRGVLRGLHYQRENEQGKLVRVLAGEIFDVVVDLRRDSSTFGKWSGLNSRQIKKKWGEEEINAWEKFGIWPKNAAWSSSEKKMKSEIKSFITDLILSKIKCIVLPSL